MLLGAAFSVVMFVVGSAVVTFVLVKLPANYFHSSHAREFLAERHPVLRAVGIAAKNVLGVMMLDFPGKRDLEARFLGQPRVYSAVNALRAKFGKPPLMLDDRSQKAAKQ